MTKDQLDLVTIAAMLRYDLLYLQLDIAYLDIYDHNNNFSHYDVALRDIYHNKEFQVFSSLKECHAYVTWIIHYLDDYLDNR